MLNENYREKVGSELQDDMDILLGKLKDTDPPAPRYLVSAVINQFSQSSRTRPRFSGFRLAFPVGAAAAFMAVVLSITLALNSPVTPLPTNIPATFAPYDASVTAATQLTNTAPAIVTNASFDMVRVNMPAAPSTALVAPSPVPAFTPGSAPSNP
jgi:hypothetical protein